MQLSQCLEAHYQEYDARIKQATGQLKLVWASLELSAEEQAAELAAAAQKALDAWGAAVIEAQRRVSAVRSSIEDMRREVQKSRELLKLSEVRAATCAVSSMHIIRWRGCLKSCSILPPLLVCINPCTQLRLCVLRQDLEDGVLAAG